MNKDNVILNSHRVLATVETLQKRIEERFDGRGLVEVCTHLLAVGRETTETTRWLDRPMYAFRALAFAISSALVVAALVAMRSALAEADEVGMIELLQALEAGINDIVFIGIAIFFLWSVERRYKRSRALRGIQKLRSIAHIIDMHQLRKDPARQSEGWADTPSSPRPTLTVLELQRYLDYCSEMLSLTAKLAVLITEHFDDPRVLASVNEVELLTTGLSRKIWQKLMILDSAVRLKAAEG